MRANNTEMLVGGVILFREQKGKNQFLVVQAKESKVWELPKVVVRRGESSVRAAIRVVGEQIGITARVLEEVGRSTGTTNLNGKVIPQKYYYYLMMQKATGGEILGFEDFAWLELIKAIKKVDSKKEKDMLTKAKDVLKEWEKTKKHKIEEEEAEAELALQAAAEVV